MTKLCLLALALILTACSPTRPTGAPFVKPSDLIGSWAGVPGVTLVGDGRRRWDYLARTADGFTFSQHGCAAPELWTFSAEKSR